MTTTKTNRSRIKMHILLVFWENFNRYQEKQDPLGLHYFSEGELGIDFINSMIDLISLRIVERDNDDKFFLTQKGLSILEKINDITSEIEF